MQSLEVYILYRVVSHGLYSPTSSARSITLQVTCCWMHPNNQNACASQQARRWQGSTRRWVSAKKDQRSRPPANKGVGFIIAYRVRIACFDVISRNDPPKASHFSCTSSGSDITSSRAFLNATTSTGHSVLSVGKGDRDGEQRLRATNHWVAYSSGLPRLRQRKFPLLRQSSRPLRAAIDGRMSPCAYKKRRKM
jgi:hypothetical protein